MHWGRHPPGRHPPVYPSMHWSSHPPPPGGHCSGRYVSYWNAFLLSNIYSSTFSGTFPSNFSTYIYVDTLQNLNFDKKSSGHFYKCDKIYLLFKREVRGSKHFFELVSRYIGLFNPRAWASLWPQKLLKYQSNFTLKYFLILRYHVYKNTLL